MISYLSKIEAVVSKLKRKFFSNVAIARLTIFIFITVFVFIVLAVFFWPVIRVGKDILSGPVNIFNLAFKSESLLNNSDGRVNVLILGTGGAIHDGPNLTDSIMVASIPYRNNNGNNIKKNKVFLISIPRDIYLDSLQGKINVAYALGEDKEKGAGFVLSKGAVSQVLGIPIHYAVQADFSAFQRIIDILGGIDVKVVNGFEDKEYPIPGKENDLCDGDPEFKCRYEILKFDPGVMHMDGALALKFVRSRHATGDEGTDFARAARQRLVVEAVKQKVLSNNLLFNPTKIEDIYLTLKSKINTDMSSAEIGEMVKNSIDLIKLSTSSITIDDLLINPPIDQRGWVLVPKDDNFDQIHKKVKSEFGN